MTTCDAYTCKAITNRTDWLAHKANATDKNTCDTNCFPNGLYVCYNDGTTPPSPKITSANQWNSLRPTLPSTATLVSDPTTCTIPALNKYYCTGANPAGGLTPWDCGQIKSWSDYNKYKNYITDDPNCDKCFPTGKFWCDATSFTCNLINSRADYIAHKNALLDNCDTCYPKGQSWCMKDYSSCDAVTSYDQWKGIDKTSGGLVTNCETCFPQNMYYCDDKKSCAQIASYTQYKNAKRPFYSSSDCSGNCGGKRSMWWLWILIIILILVAMGVIYFFMRKKKKAQPAFW